jgi:hypothetical protein
MLLSSQEPVVRQFLNARRQGPIGMAEEKDAAELEAEKEDGEEIPPLPPIPPQILPTDGQMRPTQRPPGQWLKDNGVTPPPGSFDGQGYAPKSRTRPEPSRTSGDNEVESIRVLRPAPRRRPAPAAEAPVRKRTSTGTKKTTAKKATAKEAAKKTTVRRTAGGSGSAGSRRRSS